MPQLIPQQYARILHGLTKDAKESELDDAVKTFLQFVKKNQATKKLPVIMKYFERIGREHEGEVALSVTSAHPLSEDMMKKIKSAYGDQVTIEEHTDESLVGGVVIRKGNTIIDSSVRTQLEQLKQSMI